MTAFLSLLDNFAIWFYLLGVVVILFGIKMLFDARRAGRTTLFTLEQEQASERAFRAVLVMGAATLFIAGVAAVNAFVSPAIPTVEPDGIEPTVVPFTPPIVLPTATAQPTSTLPPPTPAPATAVPATQAAVATAPAVRPTSAQTAPTEAPPTPVVEATPTASLIYPSPPLNTPPDGDSIGANNIRFSWGMNPGSGENDVPPMLPPDQFYRVTVSYTSRTTGNPAAVVVCLHGNSVDRRTGLDLTDYRTEAAEGNFKWNVMIVSSPSQQACQAGEYSALSPASPTFSFKLP